MLRFVDDYSVADVAKALRRISMSEKAKVLVYAHATAPNRAMSRLELARTIGSESVNSCNTTYGTFARNLAMALDPRLERTWRPSSGRQSDWVMFINRAPGRWTPPTQGEQDTWVFVMRETLARALAAIDFAPYVPFAPEPQRDDGVPSLLDEIDAAQSDLASLDATTRKAVVDARVGQGVFRTHVIKRWDGCCSVTGASVVQALVASHIKPWADSTNDERLDPCNGLLLVGTLDRLFDSGLITFDKSGLIRISNEVPVEDYDALGLYPDLRLRLVPPGTEPYLALHRQFCFVDGGNA